MRTGNANVILPAPFFLSWASHPLLSLRLKEVSSAQQASHSKELKGPGLGGGEGSWLSFLQGRGMRRPQNFLLTLLIRIETQDQERVFIQG